MSVVEIKSLLGKTLVSYDDEATDMKTAVREAVISGVDFSYADFYQMDISGVDFRDANLFSANFRDTTAISCNFREVNLNNTNFDRAVASESDFYGASMRMSSFFRTKLDRTNLSFVDLCYSNFIDVDLDGASLCGAGLVGTRGLPYIPTWLPAESFIGWTKVIGEDESYIVKLKILNESKRTRGIGDICHCDKALVLEIQDLEGHKLDIEEIEYIDHASTLVFKVWEVTECEQWFPGRWDDCKSGIPFFVDRKSAVLFE